MLFLLLFLFFKAEEEFEDTKGVIRIRKSKNRQHNGQKKKDHMKRTNNDLQNTHIKDRVTLKTAGELRCSGRVHSSCSTSDTRLMLIIRMF